ncbi:MAG: pectate lyase [Rariglobus sp.]|jgi:lysophospholipase L1-like esterase|nr:pectate lyase [Rariglobus sp.]
MAKLPIAALLLALTLVPGTLVPVTRAEDPATPRLTLALIGDSTVCDYPADSNKRGWGQLLPEFLAPSVTVLNEARGGLSTKTYPAELWQKVLSAKPDFVLIQFGHNDSHPKEKPEATDAATDYRENLRRFVREAREAGIEPILVTPVRRRYFKNGAPSSGLVPYADAMKAVAAELGVKLVDLHASSGELLARLGEEGSTRLTPNQINPASTNRKGDRTHFTAEGARVIAALVAADLRELDARLKLSIRPPAPEAPHPAQTARPAP